MHPFGGTHKDSVISEKTIAWGIFSPTRPIGEYFFAEALLCRLHTSRKFFRFDQDGFFRSILFLNAHFEHFYERSLGLFCTRGFNGHAPSGLAFKRLKNFIECRLLHIRAGKIDLERIKAFICIF
jgi:hypothetical protein